jgi:dCTP deaminase
MFLSADEISNEIETGRLVVQPFARELLKPASYVLRISDRWRQWKVSKEPINTWSADSIEQHIEPVVQQNAFDIRPFQLVLASTIERIGMPSDLMGVLSTLSHLARFGICVHLNSCFVSPGFGNQVSTALALEIFSTNSSPIRLEAGMPVCHLAFARTTSAKDAGVLSRSIYEGSDSLSPPRLFEEFHFLGKDSATDK